MVFNLLIKPAAEKDLEEILEWYREREKALAFNFFRKYDEALRQVQSNPEQFQKRYGDTRIVFLHPYPYGIHYILGNNFIYVLAVLHTKRGKRPHM